MNKNEILSTKTRASLTKSGLLLFLAGFIIFMGIISGEIFYPLDFNTRNNYISELAATLPPNTLIPQPSAIIFNISMIFSGMMIIIASYYFHTIFRKLLVSIPLILFGIGISGVGIFPGNIPPLHMIFAMTIFIFGEITAISSCIVVRSPLKYIFICIGITALVFLFFSKLVIPIFGVGGAERWLFYPLVFWITGLGGYLTGVGDKYSQTN
jgi:hypothetical membrane protein